MLTTHLHWVLSLRMNGAFPPVQYKCNFWRANGKLYQILVLATGAPKRATWFWHPPHVIGNRCFVIYKFDLCLHQDQQSQRLETFTVFIDYIILEYDTVQCGTWVVTLRTSWLLLSSGEERQLLLRGLLGYDAVQFGKWTSLQMVTFIYSLLCFWRQLHIPVGVLCLL